MYISEFMIKTPPQSSNSVSCREKYSEALTLLILKGLCVVVALSSYTQAYFLRWMRLGCRFKSRPGYLYIFFRFFFHRIITFWLASVYSRCRPFLASRDFCHKVFWTVAKNVTHDETRQ